MAQEGFDLKRGDVPLVLWAVGGIALAVLFFANLHQAGHSGPLLLACMVWGAILRYVPPRRGSG